MNKVVRASLCAMLTVAVSFLQPASCPGAVISVHFDKDLYIVNGPGESFEAQVLIDGNLDTAPDDLVRGGLFSFAVGMSFSVIKAQLGGPTDITVPAELEFFGFPAGSYRDVAAGFAGVKGNIDQNENPLMPYTAPWLATLKVTNLASAPDSYPLQLDFFRTLGPNEQMFLDGLGNVLDANIEFGTARVIVVPESATAVLALAALPFLLGAVRRRCRSTQ